MDDRHSIVRERQGYLGDPTSLLSRRKIKKSSTETWGDCHRHEFFEWKKHETALRKAFTDRGINGQMYAELCDECDKQLRTFRHLERDFARRSDLKKDSFFNLTRIKKITFGSAAFYKKLEDHVESLRSLNKALEAMRAVLDLEGGT